MTTTNRSASKQHWLIGLVMAAVFTVSFTLRLMPIPWGDRAVFISIAEYLRSGSRLYTDIYDNKDPLFFYAVLGQRLLGPLGEYLFELAMVAIAALSAHDIAHSIKGSTDIKRKKIKRKKLLLIAVPLLVTGTFWEPGMTHLPATALGLLAVALFLRQKQLLAGGCIALVALVKLIALPLPAIFCLTYEFVLWNPKRSGKHLKRIAIGFMTIFGVMLLVLLLRRELLSYLQVQQNNVFYSQGILVDNSSFLNALASHLRTMFTGSYEKLTLLLFSTAGMVFCGYGSTQYSRQAKTQAFLISTVVTGIASVAVLGLTGMWDHHLQLMYFSQTLMLVGVAISFEAKQIVARSIHGIAIVILAILLSGTLSLGQYVGTPIDALLKISFLAQGSPESRAFRALYPNGTGFARLGQNTSVIPYGAANDRLLCPDFSQYPFYDSKRLQSILECVATSPTIVVDDQSFVHLNQAPDWWPREAQKQLMLDSWNDFVAAGESIIKAQYVCQRMESVRICESI